MVTVHLVPGMNFSRSENTELGITVGSKFQVAPELQSSRPRLPLQGGLFLMLCSWSGQQGGVTQDKGIKAGALGKSASGPSVKALKEAQVVTPG